jgi:signal peptidase I
MSQSVAGPPETSPEQAHPDQPRRSRERRLVEWLVIVVLAVAAAVLVRTYVAQTFFIPSGSMEPTLNIGDRILVSKLATELGSVHIGEILVFKRPPGELAACGGPVVPFLVKRVIGLPGDHLTSRGNTVYVNGHPLEQPWSHLTPLGPAIGKVTVPKGHYFMMGDNRAISCDSRFWGPLSANLVVGEAVLRFWPVSHFGWL